MRQSVSQKPASQSESPWRLSQPGNSQSAGSVLAATIRWASGVVEVSPSQLKTERSRKSVRSRVSMSAKNQQVSRKCHSGSVSQKPASQLEVFSQPRLGGSVASSKEVQISRKPKQVKSQPEVETVSQPETSQSSESALAAAIRWAINVVEGISVSRKAKQVESQAEVETISHPESSVSRKCPGGQN